MKYKKYSYLIVILMMITMGINGVYARQKETTNIENTSIIEIDESSFLQTNRILLFASDCDLIFGAKNDDGVTYDPDGDGESSIRYLLNEILMYPKIIVPILIIFLGTIDLAKAVLASKEDAMKKAQTTFIKRLFIGLVIFFVPVIVDIFMYLADLVWIGFDTTCGL